MSPQRAPVIGLTGTGGAGKSSLTDELLQRFLRQFPDRHVAVVAIDPTRRRSGGALLGDRIRMNSLSASNVFMRSLATRRQHLATSAVLADVIALYRAVGFDLVVVETAGIGQSDTEIVDLADLSLYVMTAEYGAASQLEKIDMLDFADLIVLNKFEKRGAEDALRDVRKQWRRNHPDRMKLPDEAGAGVPDHREPFQRSGRQSPVPRALRRARCGSGQSLAAGRSRAGASLDGDAHGVRHARSARARPRGRGISPRSRHAAARRARPPTRGPMPRAARTASIYRCSRSAIPALPAPFTASPPATGASSALEVLRAAYNRALEEVGVDALAALRAWSAREQGVTQPEYSYTVRGREVRGDNYTRVAEPQRHPEARRAEVFGLGRAASVSCRTKTCREVIPTPAAFIRTGARRRTRHACSRARARPSAPIDGSTTWPRAMKPRACPLRSTRPRCMARIRTCGPTSSGAPAIPAFRSPRSMT